VADDAAGGVAAGAFASGVVCARTIGALASLDATASAGDSAPVRAAPKAINASRRFILFPSKRIRAGLAGTDAHDLFEIGDEDLAVADLSGFRGLLDGLDHTIQELALDRGLDLDLRQEVDDVFRAR
jgi:hypothetical protein